MSFDFVIYLDRYMDKNKEEEKVMNPIIIDLRKRKNELERQLNYLKILTTKLDECRDYARSLNGWLEKLPKSE